MIMKIISGGQTGADRAGVDAAIECGIPYGRWLQKGRKAEDGLVPAGYDAMQELTRGGYPKRTEQNIIDSDGAVVFSYGKLTGGSALTMRLCRKHGKPFLYIDLGAELDPVSMLPAFTGEWNIRTLNVAGSRESKHPGIYQRVKEIMVRVLDRYAGDAGCVSEVVFSFCQVAA